VLIFHEQKEIPVCPQPLEPRVPRLGVANPWAVVPSLGNLDAYISAVNRLPMLTPEEEYEFAKKFREERPGSRREAGAVAPAPGRVRLAQYLAMACPTAT
jgi:DNA-directed RNA polymerase sigma subunit (sigma70/sigma32)